MNGYPYNNPYLAKVTGNTINWVQGLEGAKSYVLNPGESIVLLDNEVDDIFYIKICDPIGKCTLRVFKYQEITGEVSNNKFDPNLYVKKSELESLVNSMLGGKNE